MKRLICAILAIVLLLSSIPTAMAASTFNKDNLRSEDAFAFLEILNQKRSSMGLGTLTMDRDLLNGASIRAYEQSISFSHTRPDGSKFSTVARKKRMRSVSTGGLRLICPHRKIL